MKNMVEIVIDDDKIEREGVYDVQNIHDAVDDVFVRQGGLSKEGNFYVDYDPFDACGEGMACLMFLVGKDWFRHNLKECRWYRDVHHYGPGFTYHVEDVIKEILEDWDEFCIRNGVPVNQ